MRSIRRAVRLLLGVTAGVALTLAGTLPASAATTGTTWELRDLGQRMCAPGGHPNTYFVAYVYGKWKDKITLGIRNLPPGSYSNGGAVWPGENYGNTILGFVHVSIAPAPPAIYVAELWASDGTVEQTNPIRINMREDCWSHGNPDIWP
ncbi:DUF5980 family protein [Nonomuraea rubra]